MKLQVNKNRYISTNAELEVSEDLSKVLAASYGWWYFITTDKAGNIFFNNCHYSTSTNQHQWSAKSILKTLNIPIHFTLRYTREHFGWTGEDIEKVLLDEIKVLKGMIKNLEALINKPRTHKNKNKEHQYLIKEYQYKIKDIENILKNYLNKKPIPIKNKAADTFQGILSDFKNKNNFKSTRDKDYDWSNWSNKNKEDIKNNAVYLRRLSKYFINKNNKINIQAINEVLKTSYLDLNSLPKDLNKIKTLLNINNNHNQLITLLQYRFIKDLNNMLPEIDTKNYLLLKKFITRQNITKQNLNLLSLDKIHAYLTNKINRQNHTPSEPIQLPVNPKLLKINHKSLEVIKTVQDLRREGRRQGHCIGGRQYINNCLAGYNVVNFKGYTFYLTPKLEIAQTSGRHNMHTPEYIEEELIKLIEAA